MAASRQSRDSLRVLRGFSAKPELAPLTKDEGKQALAYFLELGLQAQLHSFYVRPLLKFLLGEVGVDVNLISPSGVSLYHIALVPGNLEWLDEILPFKPDWFQDTQNKISAAQLIARMGNIEALQKIIAFQEEGKRRAVMREFLYRSQGYVRNIIVILKYNNHEFLAALQAQGLWNWRTELSREPMLCEPFGEFGNPKTYRLFMLPGKAPEAHLKDKTYQAIMQPTLVAAIVTNRSEIIDMAFADPKANWLAGSINLAFTGDRLQKNYLRFTIDDAAQNPERWDVVRRILQRSDSEPLLSNMVEVRSSVVSKQTYQLTALYYAIDKQAPEDVLETMYAMWPDTLLHLIIPPNLPTKWRQRASEQAGKKPLFVLAKVLKEKVGLPRIFIALAVVVVSALFAWWYKRHATVVSHINSSIPKRRQPTPALRQVPEYINISAALTQLTLLAADLTATPEARLAAMLKIYDMIKDNRVKPEQATRRNQIFKDHIKPLQDAVEQKEAYVNIDAEIQQIEASANNSALKPKQRCSLMMEIYSHIATSPIKPEDLARRTNVFSQHIKPLQGSVAQTEAMLSGQVQQALTAAAAISDLQAARTKLDSVIHDINAQAEMLGVQHAEAAALIEPLHQRINYLMTQRHLQEDVSLILQGIATLSACSKNTYGAPCSNAVFV